MKSDLPGLAQQIAFFEARRQAAPRSRAYLPLAGLYRRVGKLAECQRLLADSLVHDPDCLSAQVLLGEVLRDLGRTAEAQRQLGRVLERDPDNLIALRCLGEEAAAQQDWPQACAHLERLLRLLPEDAEVRHALREARRRLGEASAADRAGPAAGAPRPAANGVETPTLAELYLRQGHPAKAREIIERILAAQPGRADALAILARLDAAATPQSAPAAAGRPDASAIDGPAPAREDRPAAAGSREADLARFRRWLEGGADTRKSEG